MQALYRRIFADPEFHQLERERGRFSWALAIIIMLAYFSFILVIAFNPALFARPIQDGSIITWGLPAGLGVILLSFVLTGVYVIRANGRFDRLSGELVERLREQGDD